MLAIFAIYVYGILVTVINNFEWTKEYRCIKVHDKTNGEYVVCRIYALYRKIFRPKFFTHIEHCMVLQKPCVFFVCRCVCVCVCVYCFFCMCIQLVWHATSNQPIAIECQMKLRASKLFAKPCEKETFTDRHRLACLVAFSLRSLRAISVLYFVLVYSYDRPNDPNIGWQIQKNATEQRRKNKKPLLNGIQCARCSYVQCTLRIS